MTSLLFRTKAIYYDLDNFLISSGINFIIATASHWPLSTFGILSISTFDCSIVFDICVPWNLTYDNHYNIEWQHSIYNNMYIILTNIHCTYFLVLQYFKVTVKPGLILCGWQKARRLASRCRLSSAILTRRRVIISTRLCALTAICIVLSCIAYCRQFS